MPKTSFAQIVAATRWDATLHAWDRAVTASHLRHLAKADGRRHAARTLSGVKGRALERVAQLAPELLRVARDHGTPAAHLSVGLPRHGRLHVPPAAEPGVLAAVRGRGCA